MAAAAGNADLVEGETIQMLIFEFWRGDNVVRKWTFERTFQKSPTAAEAQQLKDESFSGRNSPAAISNETYKTQPLSTLAQCSVFSNAV
ncbi:hypothetical protein WR25_00078 [Diploscapter pachys]|uniref:Uncharacterized protein n=1 Tax=Diploscapter pachys TaxID=2018661 RepID=A0A2A2KEK1_9BILA|nr:hypothetical protein WR25_00078 [Diploscapter pachys]